MAVMGRHGPIEATHDQLATCRSSANLAFLGALLLGGSAATRAPRSSGTWRNQVLLAPKLIKIGENGLNIGYIMLHRPIKQVAMSMSIEKMMINQWN
jgi:hypothetical protein